jgi:hypothetical protein
MRDLTTVQSNRLDAFAVEHPDARVIGWQGSDERGGPVIRFLDGEDTKSLRYVNPKGRLCLVFRAADNLVEVETETSGPGWPE